MLLGYIDSINTQNIRGWAGDQDNPTAKAEIAIVLDGKIIAQGRADLKRPDLKKFGDDGKMGFDISLPPGEDSDKNSGKLQVMATLADRTIELTPSVRPQKGYQTFADQQGASSSSEKLKCLHLPERMDGKSVLDLGCNEGFFCMDAIRRGAARVVGIDCNKEFIQKAGQRDPASEYICTSWWDLPDEKFDYIYFLSAIHYEKDPGLLLQKLLNHLKPDGKLILELGIIFSHPTRGWWRIQRHDAAWRYPTYDYLCDNLLSGYSVRHVSRSVNQAGDPVVRHVIQATPKRLTVILIGGKSGTGKSSIAKDLANGRTVINFSIDHWLLEVSTIKLPQDKTNPIYEMIIKNLDAAHIQQFMATLSPREHEYLVDALITALPSDADCILLEGNEIEYGSIKQMIINRLRARHYKVWLMEKQ